MAKDIELSKDGVWICGNCGNKNEIYLAFCSRCSKPFNVNIEMENDFKDFLEKNNLEKYIKIFEESNIFNFASIRKLFEFVLGNIGISSPEDKRKITMLFAEYLLNHEDTEDENVIVEESEKTDEKPLINTSETQPQVEMENNKDVLDESTSNIDIAHNEKTALPEDTNTNVPLGLNSETAGSGKGILEDEMRKIYEQLKS